MSAPTVRCECGAPVPADVADTDIEGATLCLDCALESMVACDVCGELEPVRLYPLDGGPALDTDAMLGVPQYVAVCRACDNPGEEAHGRAGEVGTPTG